MDRLKSDIQGTDHPPETLVRRLFNLLERNHGYAETTGVSYFFVLTVCDLGRRLLKRHRLGETEMARLGLMIERALAWEPMNPYCWMLWADWFRAQGRLDAREWTLREMLRLLPDNEASRVELARLLTDRGEDHWDEAEHWLRQAVERNPDGEHSWVELARLLMRRGEDRNLEEADHLLRKAVERNPGGEHSRMVMAELLVQRGNTADTERLLAEQSHDQLRNGMDSVGDGDLLAEGADTEDHGHPTSPPPAALDDLARRDHHATTGSQTLLAELPARQSTEPSSLQPLDKTETGVDSADEGGHLDNLGDIEDHGHPTSSPPAALDELARRGVLAGEFSRARIAGTRWQTAPTERIRREARRGDPLAGFYSQWLMPEETPECPPHAWAWNACRSWQGSTQPERWGDLAAEFPEAAGETDFLRILAAPEAADEGKDGRSGVARWRARYGPDGDTEPSPSVAFMCKALERIGETTSVEREEFACTVMVGKAADIPEFAPAYAA